MDEHRCFFYLVHQVCVHAPSKQDFNMFDAVATGGQHEGCHPTLSIDTGINVIERAQKREVDKGSIRTLWCPGPPATL